MQIYDAYLIVYNEKNYTNMVFLQYEIKNKQVLIKKIMYNSVFLNKSRNREGR